MKYAVVFWTQVCLEGKLCVGALNWVIGSGQKVSSHSFTQSIFIWSRSTTKRGLVKYHRLLRNVLRAGVTCNVQSEVLTKGEVIWPPLTLSYYIFLHWAKEVRSIWVNDLNKSCINVYTDEFCFILPENRKVLEDSTQSILNLRYGRTHWYFFKRHHFSLKHFLLFLCTSTL